MFDDYKNVVFFVQLVVAVPLWAADARRKVLQRYNFFPDYGFKWIFLCIFASSKW